MSNKYETLKVKGDKISSKSLESIKDDESPNNFKP